MSGSYELWELKSRNIVGEFRSKEEALELLGQTAVEYGVDAINDYLLMQVDDDAPEFFAEKGELVTLAMDRIATSSRG